MKWHSPRLLIGLFVVLAALTSCSESFKAIDPIAFNQKIAGRDDIISPEQLITEFYDYPESEGKPQLTITTTELGDGHFEITLIHLGLDDDSQSGQKIVMSAQHKEGRWTVLEIKENWKCWESWSFNDWGTTPCS